MDEHQQRLEKAKTERTLPAALIDALLDPDMNEIGGPLYNGQGTELGEIAARRMLQIRQMTMRQRFTAWRERTGFFMDGRDGGM